MSSYPWPTGVRAVVFISVNFDAESFDLREVAPQRMFGRFSYGRYAIRAGYPRLVELFDRHGVHATFFVPGADARRHPEIVRELVTRGHEIGARGVDLENFTTLGAKELQILKSSREIIADITGSPPQGFRAPGGELSSATLGHLADLGFAYDATFQDSDYPYVFGLSGGRKLVEVPATFALDDAPIYSARHTHARLQAIWRDEFAAMHAEGTLIPLTLHLRGDFGSTRAARIAVLDTLLTELKQLDGVQFMTGQELAHYALSLDEPIEPDPYSAHVETLSKTKYRGDLAVRPL